MWIDRSLSPRISRLAKQFPALILTGARQTGKTSLLKHLFPSASVVAFDLPSVADQAETKPAELMNRFSEPVILDEVQYAPKLFRYLKATIDADRHRMGRFLMTGSQKFALMKSLSESLAGRCAVIELDTLSSLEIASSVKKVPDDAFLMWKGGFPELHRNRELQPNEYFHSYIASYLERDIRSLLRIDSLRNFERFLRACALRSGQLINLVDLGRDVGIAGSTAKDWLSILEASNQIVLLEPYFNNLGKRMIKTPKLYFLDTGLLCFLLGIDNPATIVTSPLTGALWETFVFNQLLRAKAATGTSAGLYFWRDATGTEVDFVIEQGSKVRLIEAKWAERPDESEIAVKFSKVLTTLGKRAMDEHWVACRTNNSYTFRRDARIHAINAARFDHWFKPGP